MLFELHLAGIMKPKFSILALLGFTAYIAVSIATFKSPSDIKNAAFHWFCLALLLWTAIVASSTQSKHTRVFASSFVACAVIYLLADLQLQNWGRSWADLPSQIVVSVMAGPALAVFDPQVDEAIERDIIRENVRQLLGMHCSLATGFVGGCLALWHYRRQERRANKETVE